MASEKLAIINEQLDDLLIKQLELIQDYISITVECESHQKSGFLNLAKARYIQGYHSVSKNCLYSDDAEEERSPILTVIRKMGALDLEGVEEHKPVTYEEPELNVNSDTSLETQLSNQFGMLSSTTLKTAKMDFRKCLEKTMERVKIVEQSVAIRERYKLLMKKKTSMMKPKPPKPVVELVDLDEAAP